MDRYQSQGIAVVGMACHFPGATDLNEFWTLLEQGRRAISPLARERWNNPALYDAKPGAPGKLSAYLSTIEEWAQTSPLSAGEMHQRLVEEFDVTVHLNTVKNALKHLGFVWKRTRYSLKKP